MSGMSVATIKAPEFINIESVSPLISKCEIKVLYVGENRNRSYITKEVATQIAQTLPGVPIVGQYIESKEDFGDHGQQMIIDGEGIKFNTLTKPYGFVAPDTKVWFQEFEDTDDFGNTKVREYLMTEGYLWTEQFEECKRVITDGNPQSMELDEKTLKGHWSTDTNRGIEFFVINDAIFSKLCILGEDVEPCFEGSSVTAPEVSSQFSKDEGFVRTLFSMMQELKTALEGEQDMEKDYVFDEAPVISEDKVVETFVEEIEEVTEETETPVVEEEDPVAEDVAEDVAEEAEVEVEEEVIEVEEVAEEVAEETEVAEEAPTADEELVEEDPETEFKCGDKKDKYEDKKEEESDSASEEEKSTDEEMDDEEDKKKYALLEQKYEELETKFAAMSEEYQALVEFKNSVELEKKTALIDSFYMLDDEDKADVVANKATYSLEEIESKLSVAFARKQMSVEKEAAEVEVAQEESIGAITYTLEDTMDALPAWVRAVRDVEKAMN